MAAGFVDNFAAWLAPQSRASASPRRGREAEPTATSQSDALYAYMDQMRLALRGLGEELTAVEERQAGYERQLADMNAVIGQMKTEQDSQASEVGKTREAAMKLERSQRTLAKSTQRALEEAVSAQQQLVEEEFTSLVGGGSMFPAITFSPPQSGHPGPHGAHPTANPEVVSNMVHRFETRLEHRLRDVARRIEVAQQERERHTINMLHHEWEKTVVEMQQQLADVRHAVLRQPPPPPPPAPPSPPPATNMQQIDAKVDRAVSRAVDHTVDRAVERSYRDLMGRIDAVQHETSKQLSDVRHMTRQVPEVAERVDELSLQCEQNFAKVQEYSVQFGFFRTSFEAHRHQVLDAINQLRHAGLSSDTAAGGAAEEPPYSAREVIAELRDPRDGRSSRQQTLDQIDDLLQSVS